MITMHEAWDYLKETGPVVALSAFARVLIDMKKNGSLNWKRGVLQFLICMTIGSVAGWAVGHSPWPQFAIPTAACAALLGEGVLDLLLNYFQKKSV